MLFFIPLWFINKEPLEETKKGVIAPLELGEINRGDFLVHRDHGVGICVGLSLNKNGSDDREFLVLKYADGAVLSIDVGRFDLVTFFASSETEGVVLDSLSKPGRWLRKRAAAKKQADMA